MPKSQVELFLERIRTDSALREKILKFEEKARVSAMSLARDRETTAKANAYTITEIAKEAGYDIPRDFFRETKSHVSPTEQEIEAASCTISATCCWVATSCLHTCYWTVI
jgi:hypothetical protein